MCRCWCPRRRAYGGVVKTALGAAAFSDYTIVFVDTDAGITGLGEVDSVFKRRGALLRHDLEKALVPAVIGEDPFRISRLVKKMDDALEGVEEAKAGDRDGVVGYRREGAQDAGLQSPRR